MKINRAAERAVELDTQSDDLVSKGGPPNRRTAAGNTTPQTPPDQPTGPENGPGRATTPAGGESGGRLSTVRLGGEEPDRVSTVANDP
ncbi:hypothetical protein GCM10009664_13710 [Kitasatospora gansuensis]